MLGISDTTFFRLEREGVIKATRPGTGKRASIYDLYVLIRSYMAYQARKLTGNLENPRDRAFRVQAELGELRLLRERREVLPRDEVIRDGCAFVVAAMT